VRSSWKLYPVELPFFRKKFFFSLTDANKKIWLKGTRVFSDLLDKKINIYNGAKFAELTVSKEMFGKFLGSFILSKRITSAIHSKTKRNKKGRRKKKKQGL